MKLRNRTRLMVEQLETRWCPAVTATFVGNTLSIFGTADGAISIVQDATTAGNITVTDAGNPVTGSPFTGVSNIHMRLNGADDVVDIDLGGNTLAGNVKLSLGSGANTLTVGNGAIRGELYVYAGAGTDNVTLGDGVEAFAVGKSTYIGLDGAADDVLTINALATFHGNVNVYAVNHVTAAVDSIAKRDFNIYGGTRGNVVDLNGTVERNVHFYSSYYNSLLGNELTIAGVVDGHVYFNGTNQADSFEITATGSVGRSVFLYMGGGEDTATFDGVVTGNLVIDAGGGNDTITLNSVVGLYTVIFAGAGNDTVTMSATAVFLGNAIISMGAGDDTVTLDDAATINMMLINGGSGVNTFIGTVGRPGLFLFNF